MNIISINKLTLINADFLDVAIGPESIDLVITSPPYNLNVKYNSYDDNKSLDEYLNLLERWFKKIFNVLKPEGRFCLNIPFLNNVGKFNQYFEIQNLLYDVGFKLNTVIIWDKMNMANRMKWGSFLSAMNPHVVPTVELIIVSYKESFKKLRRGKSDIEKDEFLKWTLGIWRIAGENTREKLGHPAPMPIELPYRLIKLYSYVDDVILDPFMGIGTVLKAANMLKRRAVGIEIDKEYFERAVNYFKNIELFEVMNK
ncbi:MAG: DNA-methyltransferase [Candidatus Asgardarchaeia archaeon]